METLDALPCLAGTEPQASNTMTVGKRVRNPGQASILKVQERSYTYPRVESNILCKPIIQLASVHSPGATRFSVGIRTALPCQRSPFALKDIFVEKPFGQENPMMPNAVPNQKTKYSHILFLFLVHNVQPIVILGW